MKGFKIFMKKMRANCIGNGIKGCAFISCGTGRLYVYVSYSSMVPFIINLISSSFECVISSIRFGTIHAVDFNGKPASYTRVGPVLSFFYKPDICYYGGDKQEKSPSTIIEVTAVPWKRSSVVIVMFGSTKLCETTQLYITRSGRIR